MLVFAFLIEIFERLYYDYYVYFYAIHVLRLRFFGNKYSKK